MSLLRIDDDTYLWDGGERLSLDELQALQVTRLQNTVRHAYTNVDHYRKALDDKGVHPDDIKTPDDIRLLPFTTSGKTTSTPRSSTRSPTNRCPTVRSANSSSPRSPSRPCRSCATAPATSPACCPAPPARRCAGWRRSPAAPTT